MNIDNELYSSYIESGIIKKDKYKIFRTLNNFFFAKIELDQESILIVNEHAAKGKIVYASMQTSFTSLYILINQLKKHNLPIPALAIGFIPYTYQKLIIKYNEILTYIKKTFKSDSYSFISNHKYIARMLEKESIAFSIFSRKLFIRRYVQIKTDVIEYLLGLQKEDDIPIFIFPQVIFWNRNPERSSTLITSIAVGDAVEDRGFISGIITMLKSATPAFARIGQPVNLKEILENQSVDDIKHLARQIRNSLIDTYNYDKRSVLGPQIKTQKEMVEKVLYHKNVLDVIRQEVDQSGKNEKELRKKAYRYFKEIAADFSILYIRFFKATMDYLYKKMFDGIHFDIEDFKRVREASSHAPVIFVPSHKSHMDYLIISSMLYAMKLIPPHILAGSNLTFFPMGKIFRRSGAFFMRRTFKGLNLYAAVFKQYVKTLISENYSIEFFIEGTRSRTGKIVKPKMGMLKYLIEAVDEGYNKDLVFAPLTVNYDRILEENSYQKELKGKEKSKESTTQFLKSRKLIKKKYGGVYMGFTDPFTLSDIREKIQKDKNITNIDLLTEELGYYIVRRINEAVIVTPFAIITASLLNTTARGFTRESIKKKTELLLSYLSKTEYKLSDPIKEKSIDEIMDVVLKSYSDDGIIDRVKIYDDKKNDDAAGSGLYIIDHEQRGRINFYKNSIIHMTLPLNMISLALLITSNNDKTTINKTTAEFEKIKDMFSMEFIYQDIMNDANRAIENTFNYLANDKIIKRQGNDILLNNRSDSEEIKFFAGMIQDYIESYLIVMNTISDYAGKSISRKDLIIEIRKRGTTMYHLSEIQCSEALSIINYDNALDKLIEMKILSQHGESKKAEITINDKKNILPIKSTLSNYLDKVRSS
ncbi:MAG: 1-acyl-sn-glycerol-3-phosphate acyltransferase [Leptospirales bacterium]|nr:1-acyl-sn-glycerol-3-phosphate acyltransferase [Leptospirales bacterium]